MLGRISKRYFRARGCPADMASRFDDFADSTQLNHRNGLDELLATALLCTDLNHTSCFLGDIADRSSFGHRQRHRFFAIDIFASKHRFDQ